ncbi:hypothetical protein BpHYR1_002402 [Brachionus plicatilis]|uniref:Uncharacterized protein n=1 Tax=Brachionus plicatilis TaxID=10195 RepID=A0A3M7RA46_BRAPC|nr:hypothetical protein BpHYR1_002402 [Brachionus plicatilis]
MVGGRKFLDNKKYHPTAVRVLFINDILLKSRSQFKIKPKYLVQIKAKLYAFCSSTLLQLFHWGKEKSKKSRGIVWE